MGIVLRQEHTGDFEAILAMIGRAFAREGRPGMGEMELVTHTRKSPSYVPELTLVAVCDGQIAGHAMYHRYTCLISGQAVQGAMLAPLCVDPPHHKQGIGGMLLREGDRRIRELGIPFTFHLGVPSYYPRHGYDANMFGSVCLRVSRADIPSDAGTLDTRPLAPDDLAPLRGLWHEWHADLPFAIVPTDSFTDWASPHEHVAALVFTDGSGVRGYLRYDRTRPLRIPSLLAADSAAFIEMLAFVNRAAGTVTQATVDIPLHPDAPLVHSHVPVPFERVAVVGPYGFLKVLDETCDAVVAYRERMRRGGTPGILTYPSAFDFD